MVNTEQASRIACAFLTQYYKGFVEDFNTLLPLYGDASCISFASYNQTVGTTSQGKAEIRVHYDRMQELGHRKVQIRNADFVPSADGSIAVTCSGQVFTRLCRRVFMHSFVLAPTKFRENTLFIAAECLRFLSEETENIPPNCIIVTPEEFHRSLAERSAPMPPAQIAETPAHAIEVPLPRKERPERRQKAAPAAVEEATAAPQPVQQAPAVAAAAAPAATPDKQAERKPREKKPRAATADQAAAPVASSPGPKKLTSKVRLFEVPTYIRLSDIKAKAEEFGTIVDALWFQDTDTIIEFSSPKEARNFILAPPFLVKRKMLNKSYYFDVAPL